MPAPLTLSQAADLLDVSIQDIFLKASENDKQLFKQYMNVETGVVDYYLKDSSFTGLGYAGRVVENAAVTQTAPLQGFDKTYTQVEYGILMPFTKQVWMFGIKKRDLERITQECVKAVADARERLCADRLDNSFSTTYTANDPSGNYAVSLTGGDGVALISNSHTREDGGTAWNNRVTDGSTVNMDFDYDAIKAAHRTASLITGPTGKPLNIMLDTLIVSRGTSAHFRAEEILGAVKRNQIPGSADNDGSGIFSFKVLALPWIQTNTGYWWMFDSGMKNATYGLQYKESQPIKLEGPNVVFKTGEIQYKATALFDIGHNDARNIVGSKATNAA